MTRANDSTRRVDPRVGVLVALVVVALCVSPAHAGTPDPAGCERCFGPCQTQGNKIAYCHGNAEAPHEWQPHVQICNAFDNNNHVIGGTHGPENDVTDICQVEVGEGACGCPQDQPTPTETEAGTGTGTAPPPSPPTGCGTGGPGGDGGWECDTLPVVGGALTINHAEATDVEVALLSTCGPPPGVPCCRNLQCQVEVCGSALHSNRTDRAFSVGFRPVEECGIGSQLDPCGSRVTLRTCSDHYAPPERLVDYNGWTVRDPEDPLSDELILCRVFTLAELIGTCDVDASALATDGVVTFDVYAETRTPADSCADPACDGPGECCDGRTHHSTRRTAVTVDPTGSSSVAMGAITSLNMETHLIHVEPGYDGCVCTTYVTLVDLPARLVDPPALEWETFDPEVTFSAHEVAGGCATVLPMFSSMWDTQTQECQVWMLCAEPPAPGATCPPLFCEDACTNVTASYCLATEAEGVPLTIQTSVATVDFRFCPPVGGDDGDEPDQLPDVEIDVEPVVVLEAFVGRDCVTPYPEGGVLVHGTRVYYRACVEGYEDAGAWDGVDLSLGIFFVEVVTPEDDIPGETGEPDVLVPDTRVRVHPEVAPAGAPAMPYENRSVVVFAQPAPHCVAWSQVADITDGDEWAVVLHYVISAAEEEEGGGGGGARRLMASSAKVGAQVVAAPPSEGRALLHFGGACSLGLFCGTSGHTSMGVCDEGHEPVRYACKSYEGSSYDDDDDDDADDNDRHRPTCRDGRRAPHKCHERWHYTWREAGCALIALFVVVLFCCLCYYGTEYHAVQAVAHHHRHVHYMKIAQTEAPMPPRRPCTDDFTYSSCD